MSGVTYLLQVLIDDPIGYFYEFLIMLGVYIFQMIRIEHIVVYLPLEGC